MKAVSAFALMPALSISTEAAAVEDDVVKELAPTGKLRVGVAYAPTRAPVFVAKDESGALESSNHLGLPPKAMPAAQGTTSLAVLVKA